MNIFCKMLAYFDWLRYLENSVLLSLQARSNVRSTSTPSAVPNNVCSTYTTSYIAYNRSVSSLCTCFFTIVSTSSHWCANPLSSVTQRLYTNQRIRSLVIAWHSSQLATALHSLPPSCNINLVSDPLIEYYLILVGNQRYWRLLLYYNLFLVTTPRVLNDIIGHYTSS